MAKELSKAQVNHLRRLLGWVRSSDGVFQSPEEMVATLREIAPHVGQPDEAAKQRLTESYEKAASIPKYVRAAIKALEPVVREAEGQVVDATFPVANRKTSREQPDNRKKIKKCDFWRRGLMAPK